MEIDACLLNDFAISCILVSSSSDSILKARILFSIANLISSEVLPTPEKTIFLGSPSAAMTLLSSPPETISKPAPFFASKFNIARLEFALTAKQIR